MICNKSFVFFPHNNLSEIEANTFQVTKAGYWINSWAGLKKWAILHHQDHEYFNVWIKLKQLNFLEMPQKKNRESDTIVDTLIHFNIIEIITKN